MSPGPRVLLAALVLAGAGCYQSRASPATCDIGSVRAALAAARPGDVVRLGSCTVDGPLTVPSGVTLQGVGVPSAPDAEDGTRVVGSDGSAPVIKLEGGDPPGVLAELEVDADGTPGVFVWGSGGMTIEHVGVHARGGTAVLAGSVDTLAMHDVSIEGPADEGPETAPHTDGLMVRCVGNVDLDQVTATGLYGFGAALAGSSGTVQHSVFAETLGVNLAVFGGSVQLEDVTARNARSDDHAIPPYDVVFAQGADVRAHALEASGSEGFGLLQASTGARYDGIDVSGNALGGMWVEQSSELTIGGGPSTLSDNGRVGLRAWGVTHVALQALSVSSTRNATVVLGETGTTMVGDGIEIASSDPSLSLDGVSTADNPRVGIVIDLSEAPLSPSGISNVTVDGTGDALGFVVQGGMAPPGWDAHVVRRGATLANDRAFEGRSLEGVAASSLPPASSPPRGC